ncbi:hypothetical protein CUJ90_23040 [Paraburkholderia terricola]|nr:hypothetical protein CUJ90_23040 [Paraburkholderia terricola]
MKRTVNSSATPTFNLPLPGQRSSFTAESSPIRFIHSDCEVLILNLKKLLVVLSLIAPTLSAHAGQTVQLSSLDDVENALNRGADVSVTVDLTKCAPTGTTTSPGTTRGGLKINAFRITPDGTLSFADEHATVDSSGQPIWQFIRYRVKPDQTIAFSTDLFSLPSYSRLMPEINYACAVNQGVAFFTERH